MTGQDDSDPAAASEPAAAHRADAASGGESAAGGSGVAIASQVAAVGETGAVSGGAAADGEPAVEAGATVGDEYAADGEPAAVVAFWRDLGLSGLVDVHTHFMPPNVLDKVWNYFERGREAGQAWPVVYRRPEQERVALLRAFGVRRFGALAYPHKPGMAEWLNSWAAEFAARTPDALHSATFYAEPGAGVYVAGAIGAGARLFKAHLQVGGYDPRNELLDPVWGLLAEARVPVIVHCGSGPTPGRYTGPGPISEVLTRHPGLILIVAHLGAPEYGEFFDLMQRHAGVYLDTTMAFTGFFERLMPFPAALRPRLAEAADRILLGSDFPNIPYPYLHQLEALARLDLGVRWLRAVCHDNAARLLGL